MKRLIICDTHYQIIVAIQMRLTLFKNDYLDIWISDHSLGTQEIAENIKKQGIFNNVRFIQTKSEAYNSRGIKGFLGIFKHMYAKNIFIDIPMYDEIIFYGLDFLIVDLANYFESVNHKVMWSRFEEGVFSYDTDFEYGKRMKIFNFIKKIIGQSNVDSLVETYYCFYPKLKEQHLEWNLVEIPGIDTNRDVLRSKLISVYNCNHIDIFPKYIFFASSSDIDGNAYGETELVLQVAKLVGYENILVKMHPRDTRNVYEKLGISVMRNSDIPWEVIHLIGDFSDKVLLTVNSGAFISICALDNSKAKGVFLFNMVNTSNELFAERKMTISNMLYKLKNKGLCSNIRIAQSEDDWIEI